MTDLLFGKSISQISKALDWNIKRQKMISANIANRDTPRYKAVDMDFQKVMEGVFESTGMALNRTNQAHFPTSPVGTAPSYVVNSGETRLDGNTVNLSDEVAHMVENNMLYQTLAQSLRHQFNIIKTAIK